MSTATAVTMLDVRAGSGAITLPLTTEIPYRVLTIKDTYGAAALSSITINTQGNDVFENGASSITLTNTYDTTTLYAGMPGYWYTIGGSRLGGASFNILSTGLISNPLRLGTLSTQTSIQFPGLRQGYTGTVITEQTTGAGTQELLFYKASSISDQIRLQTTGNIVFEAGAAVRSFPSTMQLATPTLYIAGSTSNIGIGTATPATTLDVAGTGRFQTLSTLNFNLSSINGQTISQLATVPLESTVIGLGSAGYVSSASLQSTFNAITYAITQNTVDTIFYFNPVIHAPTYMQMSPTQTTFPQSTLTTSIPRNTSNNAIAQFQTDFTVPQVIPNGAWDLNLFAYTDHARSYIYTSLFARAGVTETLIASSSNASINIGTSPTQQYTNTIFVPQTIFTSTTGVSLVLKIFANNATSQDDILYTFYQGANYSHAHTTFGTVVPDTLFTSTVQGLGSAGYVSTLNRVSLVSSQQINASTLNTVYLSSSKGYISSLRTDSLSVGGSDGYVTIQDLTAGTVSTGQLVAGQSFISSLQINSLSFGPTGYVIVGNFIASSLSTMKLNTQNLYANNAYIGNASTQSAILFPGIDGNFTGTAVAEQTTGAGSQELLLYKSFTAADRIRLQTTGNIVFEAGASSRNWPSTQTLATPTMYIAGSTSNVGIGTASPAATLDVVGQGRFQNISSFALNVSSINGGPPGGTPFTGSTISLSTASIFTSTLLTNNMTVNSTITANIANFSPKSIHGLQMWMDAADRTTFNYSSGSTIRYWLDKSGNGYDASNYTNAFTSTNCVVLSGSGLYTHLNASGMAGNVFKEYGFIVFTSADSTDINVLSGNYYQNRNINVQNGSFIRIHNSGGEYIANIASPQWQLHIPQLISWSSGGYIGFNASTIVNSGSNFSSYMGAWGQRNTQFGNFSGTLREIVIYQGVTLSSNDIYAVEGYLASKWGITSNMVSTHPYKNFDITTSSVTTIDAFTTLTNNNNLRITTSKYLDRSSNIYPVTAPKIQLLGHLDSRVSVQEMQTLNTGVVLTLTSGLFGTFFRLPAAPGGYYFSFPLVYLPDDIGGYWDLYNTTNGAITITVSNGRGLGNFVMNPLDICRITWSGTTHLLTYSSKWPSYLGQDITNSRLGINTGPAYTLDVAGNARFTSNVGIGTTPLSGTNYLDVIGTSRFQIISTLALNVSSINGALPGAGGSGGGTTFVGSTMFLSAAQVLISTQTNYNFTSVLGYVSSLQVDELQIGSGYGTLSFGETQMSSISSMAVVAGLGQFMTMSTLAINASSITGVIIGATFTGTLGTVSSLTALRYYGLTGSYENTAIAEVSTGVGTQELLLYKVSSISDQIRLQTTGNVIFEAGVGARTWPNAPRIATPTFYIAGSNSNVGVGTSNPLTTFDVAGTGRFQTLSSLNITAGSINYSIAYV